MGNGIATDQSVNVRSKLDSASDPVKMFQDTRAA
ncbi:hypothetical protein Vi05172_g9436 [Venturia inaequalis]|nr:hypothetical protein Vi05172_g9436 [Venturia inaequalis]